MVNSLLYDIWITSTVPNVWAEIMKKPKNKTDVDFAFLATRGGLVRFYDNGARGDSKTIDELGNYGPGFQKNRYPLYYRNEFYFSPSSRISLVFFKTTQFYINSKIDGQQHTNLEHMFSLIP